MKKLFIIATGLLGLGCLCANDNAAVKTMDWQSKLSGNVGMKFESEHVYHGRQALSGGVFVPSAEMSYQMFDAAHVYVGTEAALRMKNGGANDIAPYIGFMYDINDMFTIDAGYTHHFWKGANFSADSSEPYFGLLANVMFSPALYVEYDCKAEELNVVGTVGYSFDLSQYAISGLGVDFGAKLGYVHCNKPNGRPHIQGIDGDKDYAYYGISADLVYAITNNAKARAGIAYEGNSAKKDSWANTLGMSKNMLWFNASVDCAF